jgi:hypothetical protein
MLAAATRSDPSHNSVLKFHISCKSDLDIFNLKMAAYRLECRHLSMIF